MPNYPVISSLAKYELADETANFICEQFSRQPYYILYPLRIMVILLAISIWTAGPSSLSLWRKLPAGKMIERLLRSLVTIKFFENHEVLAALSEKTGLERAEHYRAKWNA